jgi:hypothetical protein
MDALREAGCMRLAARIDDLKRIGYRIVSQMETAGDKRYAKYFLTE